MVPIRLPRSEALRKVFQLHRPEVVFATHLIFRQPRCHRVGSLLRPAALSFLVQAGHPEFALGNMEIGPFSCRRLAAKVMTLPAFLNGRNL
jgi:hypothetical protein